MTAITGQKSGDPPRQEVDFELQAARGRWPIGCAVTLRGARMWEFLDRLVSVAIPRIRDFRGLPVRSPSTGGATTPFGIEEQIIFPEIDYDKVEKVRGMDVTFVTTARQRTRRGWSCCGG